MLLLFRMITIMACLITHVHLSENIRRAPSLSIESATLTVKDRSSLNVNVLEVMDRLAEEGDDTVRSDLRYDFLVTQVLNRLTVPEIVPMMKNRMFAFKMLKHLSQSDDLDAFGILLTHTTLYPDDEVKIVPFIAARHALLWDSFFAYITGNYGQPFYGGGLIKKYLERLIMNSASRADLRQVLDAFKDFRPWILSNADTYSLLKKIGALRPSLHQIDLLKEVVNLVLVNNPVDMFQMPLIVFAAPQNWPPVHTWPQVFFQREHNELWIPNQLEQDLIKESYLLAAEPISKDISTLSPINLS